MNLDTAPIVKCDELEERACLDVSYSGTLVSSPWELLTPDDSILKL